MVDRSLDELRARELVPFAAAVEAGAVAVMTSHILLPQVDPDAPATFSHRVLTGLLREQLGFEGVLVTDALDMAGASTPGGLPESAVRALAAGCDLLCLGNDNTDEQVEAILRGVRAAVVDGSLDAGRVEEAAARVRTMADALTAARAGTTAPTEPAAGPDDDALVGTFDVSPTAVAWRDRAAGAFAVVRLEERPNIAVGVLPWGPDLDGHREVVLQADDRLDVEALGSGPVLVLGRDVHRHGWARATVDRLREHRDVLVVDLGWPSPDRAYADVATFGASRRVGAALRGWLEGR